jgi:hypothetical protein
MRRPNAPNVVDLMARRAGATPRGQPPRKGPKPPDGPRPWLAWAVFLALAVGWALLRWLGEGG